MSKVELIQLVAGEQKRVERRLLSIILAAQLNETGHVYIVKNDGVGAAAVKLYHKSVAAIEATYPVPERLNNPDEFVPNFTAATHVVPREGATYPPQENCVYVFPDWDITPESVLELQKYLVPGTKVYVGVR